MKNRFKFSMFGNTFGENTINKTPAAAPEAQNVAAAETVAGPDVAPVAAPAPEPAPVSRHLSLPAALLESKGVISTPSAAELESLFPSENAAPQKEAQMYPTSESGKAQPSPSLKPDTTTSFVSEVAPQTLAAKPTADAPVTEERREERRRKRRARISTPVRVRAVSAIEGGPDEITTTVNVSRIGILIETASADFFRSMEVAVTLPYSKAAHLNHAEQEGRVVRVSELPDGRRSVAVAIGFGVGDLVNTAGQKLELEAANEPVLETKIETAVVEQEQPKFMLERPAGSAKPLVLVLDADGDARDSMKEYLAGEGYDVIAVGDIEEAREVLNMLTPALVIAEIEGENMPGFDLCAHCKATPRLQSIPVMLTTKSAYPSDYSNAHSLGAVVCMAKPYKQERLGHVVRLLAPPPNVNNDVTPPHPVDPTRRHGRTPSSRTTAPSFGRQFGLGGKS